MEVRAGIGLARSSEPTAPVLILQEVRYRTPRMLAHECGLDRENVVKNGHGKKGTGLGVNNDERLV
jgi:hypothetical protein